MKQLIDNESTTVEFDENQKVMTVSWKEKTQELEIATFKALIQKISELILQNKPQFYLTDDRKLRFIFDDETQKWMAGVFTKACGQAGVKKFAIVKPEDVLTELASEQVVDEAKNIQMPFESNFFDSKEKAMEWFK